MNHKLANTKKTNGVVKLPNAGWTGEMELTADGQGYVLGNGRTIYAHGGTLGIAMDSDGAIEVSEGWDGGLGDNFTTEERQEIGAYAIHLWNLWMMRTARSS